MSDPQPHPLLPTPTGLLQIPETAVAAESLTDIPLVPDAPSVFFSLIVPTYNEGKNVENLVKILSDLLEGQVPGGYELILVDDDSPDRTWEIAQSLTPAYPQLQVMRRQQERGLSTAVIRGWQAARGEVLGVIDGDLQHPPEVLLQLLAAIDQGADLAVASRHVGGGGVSTWSLLRRILSRGAQLVGLLILPGVVGRVSDPMSGYFLVRRSAIAQRQLSPLGYKILIEVLGRGKIRQLTEVGYVFRERVEGESKVTRKQYIDYLRHLVKLRLSLGLGRFLRFGTVGFTGLFVDLSVFQILRTGSQLWFPAYGIPAELASAISGEMGIINNFFWNDLWTFGDISRQQRGMKQRLKRFLKFNLVCLIGLALNTLIFSLLFRVFHVHEIVAKLIAIAIVTFWNFWINLKLSWRVTEVK